MSILSSVSSDATSIWLCDANPLHLDEPPAWWQKLVFDYDKMLRVMPSQKDHVYRLCRVVRQEARLGLNALVIHDHPDTRAMIKFGVVPVATLPLWAVRSDKILRELRDRDLWNLYGGDPTKIADAVEAQEQAKQQQIEQQQAAHLDEINTDTFRALKYGYREQVDVGTLPVRYNHDPGDLPPLPALPPLAGSITGFVNEIGQIPRLSDDLEIAVSEPPLASPLDLQNRDRAHSALPVEGTATSPPPLTDSSD